MGNAFLNGGQTCMAWTRMLVARSQYGEALDLIEAAVARYTVGGSLGSGHPHRTVGLGIAVQVGEGGFHRARPARRCTASHGGGAEQVRDVGYFLAPTVFADVDPNSELGQEEVFGPVLAVIPFDGGEDEALEIANGTPYGLAGAVWAKDTDTAVAFARGRADRSARHQWWCVQPDRPPFGGYKKSGIGRELGRAGFEEFLQTKSLQLPEPA